jgi:hypothetical protein
MGNRNGRFKGGRKGSRRQELQPDSAPASQHRKGRIKPLLSIDLYSVEELRELKAAGLERKETIAKAIEKSVKENMPVTVIRAQRETAALWHGDEEFPGLADRIDEQMNVFDPRYMEPRSKDEKQLDWTQQGGAVASGQTTGAIATEVLRQELERAGIYVSADWLDKWSIADRQAAWDWLQAEKVAPTVDDVPAAPEMIKASILLQSSPGHRMLGPGEPAPTATTPGRDFFAAGLRERLLANHLDVPMTWLLRLSEPELALITSFAQALEAGQDPELPGCFSELAVIRSDKRKKVTVYAEVELEATTPAPGD